MPKSLPVDTVTSTVSRRVGKSSVVSKIFGLLPEDPEKPLYSLFKRGGRFYMLYRNADWKTGQYCLGTSDEQAAIAERDSIRKAVESAGRASLSKKQAQCVEILKHPKEPVAIRHVVQLNGHTIWHDDLEEALATQSRIAREVVDTIPKRSRMKSPSWKDQVKERKVTSKKTKPNTTNEK